MQNRVKGSVIAAAVVAALGLSMEASAEATVYGQISVSAASLSQDDAGTESRATAISSHASRLGVKGNKQMENGMELVGVAEFEYDTVDGSFTKSYTVRNSADTGSTTVKDTQIFKPRNMYVGVKGGFGEVRVGHMDTPHKVATSSLDPFGDTYADYNNIITVDNRLGNVMAYVNKFGSVGVAAAYHAGDDSVTAENDKSATSIMVNYDANGLYLAAAVESYADVAANSLEGASVVGVGYSFGPAKLGLVYERLAYEGSTIDDESELYASLQWKLTDTGTLKAAYGKRDDGVSATDDEVMAAIGYDYKMDKDANLYVLYAKGSDGGLANKAKLSGDGSAAVVGLVYKF